MTTQTDIRTTNSTTGTEELPIVNSKVKSTKVDSIEEEDKYRNTREAIQNYKEIFVKKYNRNSGDYKPFEITLDYLNKIYQEFTIEDVNLPQYQHEFMDYLISNNKEYPDLQVSFYRHLKGKFERGLL